MISNVVFSICVLERMLPDWHHDSDGIWTPLLAYTCEENRCPWGRMKSSAVKAINFLALLAYLISIKNGGQNHYIL